MRRKQNKKTHFVFKLNFFKFLSIILFILILFLTPYLLKTTIKITKIECVSQYGECPAELNSFLVHYSGFNYYVVKKNMSKFLDENFLVENYLTQYKIPSTLKVDLNIKKPQYSFFLASYNKYFLVTSDGVVIDIKDTTSLPNINIVSSKYDKEYKFGDMVDSKIKFSYEILKNLSYLYSIKELNLEDTKITVTTNEGVTLLIPNSGEVDFIIGSIRIIFSRLNDASQGIKMSEVREIDLRFKNPIIRRW